MKFLLFECKILDIPNYYLVFFNEVLNFRIQILNIAYVFMSVPIDLFAFHIYFKLCLLILVLFVAGIQFEYYI